MILMGMIALVFFAFPGFFIRLFIADPTVVDGGIACLRIISTGYVTYALGMVVVQAFNGAGDTSTPAFINLFCFWLFEIPLAYILALPAGFRENGVYIAIVVAETLMSVIAAILFKRGRWKDRQI